MVPEKPTFLIYIIVCFIFVFAIVILLCTLFGKKMKLLKSENISIDAGNMFSVGKINCDLEKTYCFTDDDCFKKCVSTTSSCIHGICSTNINTSNIINDCDPTKGILGYLVGNTALGTYSYVCKSIDPAIAISVNENRMCYGDKTYQIDYLKSYPSIYSCTCSNQVVIGATSEKRRHVECDSRYIDLVPT